MIAKSTYPLWFRWVCRTKPDISISRPTLCSNAVAVGPLLARSTDQKESVMLEILIPAILLTSAAMYVVWEAAVAGR